MHTIKFMHLELHAIAHDRMHLHGIACNRTGVNKAAPLIMFFDECKKGISICVNIP